MRKMPRTKAEIQAAMAIDADRARVKSVLRRVKIIGGPLGYYFGDDLRGPMDIAEARSLRDAEIQRLIPKLDTIHSNHLKWLTQLSDSEAI